MSTLQQTVDDLNKSLAVIGLEFEVAKLEAAYRRKYGEGVATGGTDEVVGMMDFTGKAMPAAGGGQEIVGQAGGVALDRHGEAFLPGVLEKAARRFMATNNPVLLYHHHPDQALGTVKEARADFAGNLRARAHLDEPEPYTPLADVYRKVKSGTIRGLSVGGPMKRKMTPAGMRIWDFDMYELSVTPLPAEPNSIFTLSGKAVSGESVSDRLEKLSELRASLGRASAAAARL